MIETDLLATQLRSALLFHTAILALNRMVQNFSVCLGCMLEVYVRDVGVRFTCQGGRAVF
jgi:hypothetical protein